MQYSSFEVSYDKLENHYLIQLYYTDGTIEIITIENYLEAKQIIDIYLAGLPPRR